MEITVFSPAGRILFSHNSSKDKEQAYYNEHFMIRIRENFAMMHSMMPDRGHHDEKMMPHERMDLLRGSSPPPDIIPDQELQNNSIGRMTPPDDFQDRDSSLQMPDRRNNQRIGQFMRKRIEDAFPGQALIRPVITDRQIRAFVKVKSLRLKFYDRVNRKFINSIFITVICGSIAAFLIAVISSWFISNKLSRDAASLSSGLNRLAGGVRNVVFRKKDQRKSCQFPKAHLYCRRNLSMKRKEENSGHRILHMT